MNVNVTDGTRTPVTVQTGSPIVVQPATGPVTTVNGQTGAVTITAANTGADPAGAATAAVATHVAATDPHGDRAYAASTFLPLAGGTLTGALAVTGGFGVDTAGNVTANTLALPAAATTLSKALIITAPAGAATYVAWRAPKACTVVAVRGYRTGGTGATINAVKNAADLLATDLSLSTAATWLSGPSVQNTAMVAGDTLTLAIRSVAGSPTAVTIQVDLQGA